jgi:hypothetical protein
MACFVVPAATAIVTTVIRKRVPEKYHLNWLNLMLWGGVAMSTVEHIMDKEIIPYPPFLANGLSWVSPEMLKVGVPMTIVIFLLWSVMVVVVSRPAQRIKRKVA